MTSHPLPSGGGAFVRDRDGTLRRIEDDPLAGTGEAAVESPIEGAIEAPVQRASKGPGRSVKEF